MGINCLACEKELPLTVIDYNQPAIMCECGTLNNIQAVDNMDAVKKNIKCVYCHGEIPAIDRPYSEFCSYYCSCMDACGGLSFIIGTPIDWKMLEVEI